MDPTHQYDVKAAAAALGMSPRSVTELTRKKRLTYRRVSNRLRFCRSDIENYLVSTTVRSAGQHGPDFVGTQLAARRIRLEGRRQQLAERIADIDALREQAPPGTPDHMALAERYLMLEREHAQTVEIIYMIRSTELIIQADDILEADDLGPESSSHAL